tara:strand:+ start:691 stop:2181 length:1491 start_codon:yes stop_codon:yes gene_type:complete
MSLNSQDLHALALNPTRHLGAFEETNGERLDLVQHVREKFDPSLEELDRNVFHLKQHRFNTKESKWRPPAQTESPHVSKNVDLNQVMFLLLEQRTTVKALLRQFYEQSDKYDVERDYNIQLDPLINLHSLTFVENAVKKLLPKDFDPTDDMQFMKCIDGALGEMHEKKLTGSNHRFLPKKTQQRKNVVEYRNATKQYVQGMGSHYTELDKSGDKQDVADMIKRLMPQLICALKINELSKEAIDHLSLDDVLKIFTDEIAQALHIPLDIVAESSGLVYENTPRSVDFLDVGSKYGDCTSRNKDKQVDQVENIFWTMASHMLDTFYQVAELQRDGHPIIKTHVLPCTFLGRTALHIDAIETHVCLRDYLSATEMTPNPQQDMVLAAIREDLLSYAYDRVESIADQMGIELVTVDGYSNTRWVQKMNHRLQSNIYHIKDFNLLYDGEFIGDFAQFLLDTAIETKTEIQALNLNMTHADLELLHKRNSSLRGGTIRIRGI